MKGLDSYPYWVRESVGVVFIIAAIPAGVWRHDFLCFLLGMIGVGLLTRKRDKPAA